MPPTIGFIGLGIMGKPMAKHLISAGYPLAIKGGMAGGRTLDMKASKMAEQNFEPGFKMDLHIKDLKNALQAGKALGVPLPSTGLIHELFSACSAQGKGQKDHSVIFTLIEQMAGLNR